MWTAIQKSTLSWSSTSRCLLLRRQLKVPFSTSDCSATEGTDSSVFLEYLQKSKPAWVDPDLEQMIFPLYSHILKDWARAMDNFERICGVPRHWLEIHCVGSATHLVPWKDVERGTDLWQTAGTFVCFEALKMSRQRRNPCTIALLISSAQYEMKRASW